MQIILLSGGSGKKLWPLSNDVQSKQYIKLLKGPNGASESMIQRIYRQLSELYPDAEMTVATFRSQVSVVHDQIGEEVQLSVEPDRKNTFPAVVLASQYLKDIRKIDGSEYVVVCPVDLYMEDQFFKQLRQLFKTSQRFGGIAVLGTEPRQVQPDYGYIVPENTENVSRVLSFVEKPDAQTAKKLIQHGALFNAGFFAFQLNYILELSHHLIDYTDYDDLFNLYKTLIPSSFERSVLEKSENVHVLRSHAELNDLGTWEAITKITDSRIIGNGYMNPTCGEVSVINNTEIPVLAVGLQKLVIAASQQGILVSSKEESTDISPYVDHISRQVMFAQKSWGTFKVLDVGENSMTIKLFIRAGHRMSYHSHAYRDESWTVLSGSGRTIVDGMEQQIGPGDVVTMEAGCRHTICADTDMEVIEIQRGKEITVLDKKKFVLE
jgi:mannose-1-phosphate guanylyltransferase